MKIWMSVLAALAMLVFAGPASAGHGTDGPEQHLVIVKFTDLGMSVLDQGSFTRGAKVTFSAFNSGLKVHNFTVLGKTTGPIKPNTWGHVTVTLTARGKFQVGSTLDKGAKFHAYYRVT